MEEIIHVTKDKLVQHTDYYSLAEYRTDCLDGAPHPLGIESHAYRLTTLVDRSIDDFATPSSAYTVSSRNTWTRPGQVRLSADEIEFLKSLMREPAIAWAVDNSFDGLYVRKNHDHTKLAINLRLAAYLKEEHLTFWKLKFAGAR